MPRIDLSHPDLASEFSWPRLVARAGREAIGDVPPPHLGPAELLDHFCLPLLDGPTPPLWILLENEAARRESSDLLDAIVGARASALAWLTDRVGELQRAGAVDPDSEADAIAAVVLIELDDLWASTLTDPAGARAHYARVRSALLDAYRARGQRAS